MRAGAYRSLLVWLTIITLLAGCGSASPSQAPPSPTTSQGSPTLEPSLAPPASALPTPTTSADPFLGQLVVAVSADLRVRSQPWVGEDSIKYEPLLPIDTELRVLDGPVEGSGYVWYQVEPVGFSLSDGPGYGWVAMASKDGEPWIALAGEAIPTPASSTEPDIAGIELAKATVPRAPADPAAAKTAAASINAFGLDLLRAMLANGTLKPDANAVLSPASIALALAMARAGAKGDTAAEMDAVLHTAGWDELGPGLNALEQALASRNATWEEPPADPPVIRELALRIANAAFAQRDWEIEQAYLERIGSTFGAGVRLLDYRTDPEAARKLINAWVSEQTKERIPELIPPPEPARIKTTTRLVLVNAVYLKAGWELEFPLDATKPLPFTRLDGGTTDVATMHQQRQLPYARGNGWQATELLYRSPHDPETGASAPLAMTLILPDELAAFEDRLTGGQLDRIVAALDAQRTHLVEDWVTEGVDTDCTVYWPYDLSLYMPKFGIDTKALLGQILKGLGMPLAFDEMRADFTDIHVPKIPQERLYIGDVIHQANIDVDEKGTEAAAATAVIMGDTTGGCGSGPRKVITFRLDSPFLFVLRDVETGAVLFMGRVVEPSVGR